MIYNLILDKDDIQCCKIGNNFIITKDGTIEIILTPEAIQELINDFKILNNE